jgi:hypothetical protein
MVKTVNKPGIIAVQVKDECRLLIKTSVCIEDGNVNGILIHGYWNYGREEGRWVVWSCRMNETCVQSYHNEQSAQLSGAYMYMYTKLQTQWHIHCQVWLISLSQTFLYNHCSNNTDISTVVMLGFWFFQYSTGSLAWGLCLLLSIKDFFFLVVAI